MVYMRGNALALLVLCGSLAVVLAKPDQLAPGIIPIPDDTPPAPARPATLKAPAAAAINPAAVAGAPAFPPQPGFGTVDPMTVNAAAAARPVGFPAQPGFGAAAAAPAAGFPGAFPAQPGFGAAPAAAPGFGFPAANPALPAAGFPAQPGFGAAAQPGFGAAAQPGFGAAAQPGFGAAAQPGFGAAAQPGFPAGFPGAAGPVFPVGGAMPGAMPGLPGAFGPQLPPGLISTPLPAVPAPPPRARPAAPPAPPIPRGKAVWKPQWDELKDFTDNEVIVSFNVANTPEQIFWNQKKVREALAKAGGILPNSISYYQVLPSTDDYGRPFTTVRFVVQNRNADLASNLMSSLNVEGTQNKLKNRIEELNLDLIGDSMKAQTPTDFKAASRAGASNSALPSSTMMDTTGGMNGVAAAAAAGPGLGGPGLGAGTTGVAVPDVPAGNATSTAGLPGMGAGGAAARPAMTRRQQSGAVSAAAGSWLLAAAVAAGAFLL